MKRASTLFLKAVILLLGIGVLTMCVFLFPELLSAGIRDVPEFRHVYYPAIIGVFLTTIPFFFALYQAFKLLHYIDKNNAFSELSIQALRYIKYCGIAMSVFYAVGMPFVVVLAELDDAPGAIVIGMAIVVAPLIVATFAAVLQKLVQNAVDMKLENDLTV
ncbi:MAG: DUF2975 domain-containing protein [Candidatus Peribacteraceae bacterium]|nr:DUF2975 domain-containing protein [Candidatus Peribacteraceae bacterium]